MVSYRHYHNKHGHVASYCGYHGYHGDCNTFKEVKTISDLY